MKKLQFLLAGAVLAFTCAAKAQALSGSISASVWPNDAFGTTSSSLLLFQTNVISAATGDFASTVPVGGILYGYYPQSIDGLSTTPLTDPINNFFVFSDHTFGVSGTTPIDRFDFDLATITEDSYDSATGAAVFSGTGTLVDSTGALSSQQADFTVDFSNSRNYTISIVTVPEPATVTLVTVGLLGVLALCRRKA